GVLGTALVLSLGAHVTVDVGADQRAISPGIYGLSGGSDDQVKRLKITVHRFGGNGLSLYNFKTSTTNEGGDGLFFRNQVLADAGSPDFAASFIDLATDAGAQALIELPLLGYVAKGDSAQEPPWTCAFSVAKYGAQASVAPDDSDCGNGVLPDGGP